MRLVKILMAVVVIRYLESSYCVALFDMRTQHLDSYFPCRFGFSFRNDGISYESCLRRLEFRSVMQITRQQAIHIRDLMVVLMDAKRIFEIQMFELLR